jgi:hypothetical protein
VSGGPPGSSWVHEAPRASNDADATRARRFREVLRGRAVAYGLVLGCVAALVAGAALGSVAVLVAGPLAVACLLLVVAFVRADRRAELDFFEAYANAHGLVYVGTTGLQPLTPLLGAGDRRRTENWMVGALAEGVHGGLGHHRVQFRKRGAAGDVYIESHDFTVCAVDLEDGIRLFQGIFLTRKEGAFKLGEGSSWASHHGRHQVELESGRLCERCELWVDDAQEELLLRELFTPSLQVLLAEHPLEPCFEYRAGMLVVYVERKLEDEGHLDWMREVSARIASRFTAEVQETTVSS